jgi:serine/threonine-protein kinase
VRVDLQIGSELAGYRILALAGRGGMGMVYRAEHLRLGRTVALKVLATELATDQTFRERFERESRLAALIDHPNIIPVYEEGETEGLLYIAMRWVEGSDLREILDREGPLDPERVVALLEQVAAALDAAHQRGLLHRDVKPGNVLVTHAGGGNREHVYLTDFGIAKLMSASALTRTGSFLGTPDYAAPEQFAGKELDPRADVYALGCLLFHCLSGHRPYERTEEVAVMYAHLNEPPPSISALRSDVPAGFDDVIAKAMAKKPEDRYPSCTDVAAAARAVLRGGAAPTALDVPGGAAAATIAATAAATAAADAPAGATTPAPPPPATPAPTPPTTPVGTPPTTPVAPVTPPPATPAPPVAPPPAAAPAPAPPPAPPPLPAEPTGPGKRRRRLVAIGAVVALVAVGGAVAAVLATRGGDGETAAPSPPAESPAPPADEPAPPSEEPAPPAEEPAPPSEEPAPPAPPTPPAQVPLELQWTRLEAAELGGADDQDMLRTTTLASGPTVLAVGTVGREFDRDAVVWRITGIDSSPTVEVEPIGGSGEEVMFGVAPVGDGGFVAVGYRQPEPPPGDTDPAVWLSAGGPVEIVTEGLAGAGFEKMNRVTPGPGGELVAVGSAGPGYNEGSAVPLPTDAAAWISTDGGASWSRFGDGGLAKDGYQEMRAATAFGNGFVGVGYDTQAAAVWVNDGISWGPLGDQPDLLPGGDAVDLHMRDVVSWPGGLVAGGEVTTADGDENAALWFSPDGQTWTLLTDDETFGGSDDQRVMGVTAGDFGIVAVGCSGCRGEFIRPVVWTSSDGETWTRTDADQLPSGGAAAQLNALTVVGTTVVGVGWEQGPSDRDATVWTAPLPG